MMSDSIDDLLADVKQEFTGKKKPQSSQKPLSVDDVYPTPSPPIFKKVELSISSSNTLEDNLLSELKEEWNVKIKQEKQEKEAKLLAEQQLKEQQEKEKKLALTKQAQEWLKNLDPNSDEGFWFMQFAYSYRDQLSAAIDYLQAMQ